MRFVAAMFLILAFAGCVSDDTDTPTETSPDAQTMRTHALFGMVEPEEFNPPIFQNHAVVATGGPLYGAGEPSIWAALDGSIYAAFPGCDDGPYYFVSYPGSETCGHGLVFKSVDNGGSWDRLNSDGDGLLTPDGPVANGDADVAVDAAGTVYTSNLGGGIQFHRSLDGGANWDYMANIVPENEGADRQWLAAAAPGHVVNAWMRTSPSRDVGINTTFDGGETWTGEVNFGDTIGWLGTPQFDVTGTKVYIPYTQPTGGLGVGLGVAETFEMHVLGSMDGGRNWTDVPTGMIWETTATGVHWSGGHMAPTLDVTGDGTVVVGMAVDHSITEFAGISSPVPEITNLGTKILLSTSSDDGANWTSHDYLYAPGIETPILPTTPGVGTVIFPWITGGAGDRFAVTYFTGVSELDQDVAPNVWDLRVSYIDGIGTSNETIRDVLIDDDVHEGPICTRGGVCAGPGDRTLLDFFESDISADGNLVVVYPADPILGGKEIEIRVAVQSGGTPLATTLKSESA